LHGLNQLTSTASGCANHQSLGTRNGGELLRVVGSLLGFIGLGAACRYGLEGLRRDRPYQALGEGEEPQPSGDVAGDGVVRVNTSCPQL
jgi:hypothetical protein